MRRLPGYQRGEVWFKELIGAYETKFGEKPPVDVWAIDIYPIDWINTPNSAEHASIAIDQLRGMRQYLDTVPEYADTPIWITEIAVHVGYDGWKYDPFPRLAPVGKYHWDKMSEYLTAVLDWLEANGDSNKIEKWFFMITWADIVDDPDDYIGIIFFDGGQSGGFSQLSR